MTVEAVAVIAAVAVVVQLNHIRTIGQSVSPLTPQQQSPVPAYPPETGLFCKRLTDSRSVSRFYLFFIMQQLVFFSLQDTVVQAQGHRVLPGGLDLGTAVETVQAVLPRHLCLVFQAQAHRLAAAVDASVAAGHDLDEVVVDLTGFDLVEHLRSVAQSVDCLLYTSIQPPEGPPV